MSADYYSIAVVGVPITGLFREREGFLCGHAATPGKFCSECGKGQGCILEHVEWLDPDAMEVFGPACHFDAQPLDYETAHTPDGVWFVGLCCEGWEGYPPSFISLVDNGSYDVNGLRGLLQDFLEPLGKWEPEKFGLWCFVRVSY